MERYYDVAEQVLSSWATDRPKQCINFLIEFLSDDKYWLNNNISQVDRELFILLARYLEINKEKL